MALDQDAMPDIDHLGLCPICNGAKPFWDGPTSLTCNNAPCQFSIDGLWSADRTMQDWQTLCELRERQPDTSAPSAE